MEEQFKRTEIILGTNGITQLKKSNVLIAGLGGVGSWAAEFIARAGIGRITIIDHDLVSKSNINRQLVALHSTIGLSKTEIMSKRIKDINPACQATSIKLFITPENVDELLSPKFDAIIDCIDNINSKAALLENALKKNLFTVSSMGAGWKTDTSKIKICDLTKTKICPLARRLRKELGKRGVGKGIIAVYSDELLERPQTKQKTENGTTPYLPAAFGITLSSLVINHLSR